MDRNCLRELAARTFSKDPLQREAEIIKGMFSCVADNSGRRPSVETSLHNLLNFSFVVHTHPTLVNGLMCAKNSHGETIKIFGEKALVIEYTDPGYILFKLVEKRISEYILKYGKEPQIIFLENHGVFVSANTIDEIKSIYSDIMNRIQFKVLMPIPSHKNINTYLPFFNEIHLINENIVAQAFQSELINEFIQTRETFLQADTAFSPDNIVYCKAHYLFSEPDINILKNDYNNFKEKHGYFPKVIAIEKAGLICLEENESSLKTVFEVYLDILKISFLTRNFGGPRFMTPKQIEFIDNWEVENYRRKVAKKS
jgi:rhamnose utilization protein RhaD (predicted bifunctional aldolase and dehydrogenase)